MKINEVVTLHPSVAAKSEYDKLLHSDEELWDEIVEFIMDDNNAEARRLSMMRHLDELLGDVSDHYGPEDLYDFMHDVNNISDEEAIAIKKDMKLPPYHLSVVDETQDDEIPTGEYEICQTCGGEGEVHWDHTDEWTGDHVQAKAPCPDCEEGLKDITGMHKVPDFSDYKGE